MAEIKQTAVEWLVKIYLQTNKIDSFDIEQAKEMEKEQIKESFKHGRLPVLFGSFDAEQYYKETYGK